MKKKYFGLVLALLLSFCVNYDTYAQLTKTFKSEKAHFSLVYPSSYRAVSIENAPHMILHLINDKKEEYTFSCWELGLDESIDAWNKEFYQELVHNATKATTGPKLLSYRKTTINLKNKTIRAAELIHSRNDRQTTEYVVTYQFFWKGNMIQIMYVSEPNFTFKATKGTVLLKSILLQE